MNMAISILLMLVVGARAARLPHAHAHDEDPDLDGVREEAEEDTQIARTDSTAQLTDSRVVRLAACFRNAPFLGIMRSGVGIRLAT